MKILIGILVAILLVLSGLITFLYVTKYNPPTEILLSESQGDTIPLIEGQTYSAMIWNIGYAGLDGDMDFFYDGGKHVRPTEKQVKRNFEQIKNTMLRLGDTVDFVLLQEVDEQAKRSYYIPEVSQIRKSFSTKKDAQFALNYNVKFVPLPLYDPMGAVKSGLLTLSNHLPYRSTRYAFPSDFGFPMNLAMLQRCFMVNRYQLSNGKSLIVINTHNSAYDDGTLRSVEMVFFKKYLMSEYEQGNYVLVGGDWNQCPPNLVPQYKDDAFDTVHRIDIAKDYLPHWQWAYDATVPTNRRVQTPYKKGETKTTIIDFYLLSPNLELVSIAGQSEGFLYSDHNPVLLQFKIK